MVVPNSSAGQTHRVKGESFSDDLFVIPHEPRKKKTFITYIYNDSNKDPFYSPRNYKIPAVTEPHLMHIVHVLCPTTCWPWFMGELLENNLYDIIVNIHVYV